MSYSPAERQPEKRFVSHNYLWSGMGIVVGAFAAMAGNEYNTKHPGVIYDLLCAFGVMAVGTVSVGLYALSKGLLRIKIK